MNIQCLVYCAKTRQQMKINLSTRRGKSRAGCHQHIFMVTLVILGHLLFYTNFRKHLQTKMLDFWLELL